MRGFFTRQETQSTSRPDGRVHSCASCGMYQHAVTPRMPPHGAFAKRVMIIGEAPSEADDAAGKPWQDAAGRRLRAEYQRHRVSVDRDCVTTYAVFCCTANAPGAPNPAAVASCRSRLLRLIKQYAPHVIILHGPAAVEAIIGHRRRDGSSINKWRGWTIPDRELNAWLCPTFSPAWVESQDYPEVRTIWAQDVARALALVDTPLPSYTPEAQCVELGTPSAVLLELRREVDRQLNRGQHPVLALDIETTGLKPYNRDVHQIACISLCMTPDKVWVIPAPVTNAEIGALKWMMLDKRVGKVAANMKFEDTWLKVMYDIDVVPWVWDTMLAAHVLDNRPGITGLKFQSYVQFGVESYDDDVAPYIRSDDPDTPNRVMECMASPAMREKLMVYCGIDSLLTRRLALVQARELGFEDICDHS